MASDIADHMLRLGRRDFAFEVSEAFADLRASGGRLNLAWALALHDVASRYRGSILGPFWITLSMAVTAAGVGLLYARLFQVEAAAFVPYVALGLILFGFVAGMINEGCETFVQARAMLSQTRLPMLTFVWRGLLRNLINLGHHAVVALAVLVWAGGLGEARWLPAVAGLVLVVVNTAWISLFVGLVAARYRDVPPIVAAVLQLAMLLTPIFWRPDRLGDARLLLDANPFRHLIEVVRAPLLGGTAYDSLVVLAVAAVAGWIAAFALFAAARRSLVHYL